MGGVLHTQETLQWWLVQVDCTIFCKKVVCYREKKKTRGRGGVRLFAGQEDIKKQGVSKRGKERSY